jgi:hypothetical protein
MSDTVELSVNRPLVQRIETQRGEDLDTSLQDPKGLPESKVFLNLSANHCHRIWDRPKSYLRITRPFRDIPSLNDIADGEDELHLRRIGCGELIPGFALKPIDWHLEDAQKIKNLSANLPCGFAAGTESLKPPGPPMGQQGFSHNAAGGIELAQEQNIVCIARHHLAPDRCSTESGIRQDGYLFISRLWHLDANSSA